MSDPNRNTPRYRVAWVSKTTGFSSHGEPCSSKEIAEAWVAQDNKDHPELHHWVEPVPTS